MTATATVTATATATVTATAATAVATGIATVRRRRPNVSRLLSGRLGRSTHIPLPPAAGDRDRRDSGRDRRDSGRGSERGDRSDRSDRDRRDRGGPDRDDERPPRPVREPSPDPVQREREEAMRSDLTVLVQRIHPRADDFEIFEFFSQVRREA